MATTKTNCPTCGAECKIGGDSETHFFIPISEGTLQKNNYSLYYFKEIAAKEKGYNSWQHFVQTNNNAEILIITEYAAELYARHKFIDAAKKVLTNLSETFLNPNNLNKSEEINGKIFFEKIGEKINNFPIPEFE